jgi:hypothetical protein
MSHEPGPIRRALFQQVPYILDSIWRHSEFALHRVGRVGFDAPNPLQLRPGWMSVSFVMYALVGLFAIFGPTLDALCSLADIGFTANVRAVVSTILLIVAVLLFMLVLNATTWHLTRNTEDLADKACALDPHKHARRQRWNGWSAKFREMLARSNIAPLFERLAGSLVDLAVASRFIPAWERVGLALAFLALFLGTVLLIGPLFVTSLTLKYVPLDPATCTQVPNQALVYVQLAAYATLLAGGFFIWRHWAPRHSVLVFATSTALLVSIVALLWWQFTPAQPSEAAGGFYPHVYIVVVGILLITAIAARVFAWVIFRKFPADARETFAKAVHREDLLRDERPAPDVSWLRLGSAALTGITANLLHFLLLPAFVAFIVPSTVLLEFVIGFAAISFVLVLYATLSKRWEQMLINIDRWFLVGTPLVVSLFVIAIGIARLANFQYVTTVLDATPTGVLFISMVMLYVAVWLFEYWINRWLGDELLGVLCGSEQARRGWLPLRFQSDPSGEGTWAEDNGRHLALHSTGRFCALGWYSRKEPKKGEWPKGLAFTTYGFAELFYALGRNHDQATDMAHDVERRVMLYFNSINIALIVVFLLAWRAAMPPPLAVEAMVNVESVQPGEAAAPAVPAADTLADRIAAQAALGRPSLIVAASGGGTRAAVYTAVALEGMARIDRARDVVLLSGVSGGGVSAAVFASRYAELIAAEPKQSRVGTASTGPRNPWDEYVAVVSAPYIQDVLEGMGELRIAGTTSLGALLQESLEHRAFANRARAFGDLEGPALILNTAVSGHPYEDSQLMAGRIASPSQTAGCRELARPYANLAGGRLIFTNLKNLTGFPQPPPQPREGLYEDPPDMWLPYSIVNIDAVPLAAASALTANFPPVFSNARVRLYTADKSKCPRSYFVTDGGATENLGLVSALYALRGSVRSLPEDKRLADIHLLAFEASAIDYDYSDDRGIGAATGGSKERINAGLTQMLLEEVRGLVTARGGRLRVHYLPLPVAFRSRGGFGTHWMFAPSIRLTNPHVASVPDDGMFSRESAADFVVLDRPEVMSTMRALFDPVEPMCARAERVHTRPESAAADFAKGWTVDVQHVARWICGYDDERGTRARKPDYQVEAWLQVLADLKPAAAQ